MSESQNYIDDLTITNDADLWRRIPPWHIVTDENNPTIGIRISSAAFDNDKDSPMSVTIADIYIKVTGKTAEAYLKPFGPGFALASFTAGFARKLHQVISPDPNDDDPGHAFVAGKKNKTTRREFAKHATWIISPC